MQAGICLKKVSVPARLFSGTVAFFGGTGARYSNCHILWWYWDVLSHLTLAILWLMVLTGVFQAIYLAVLAAAYWHGCDFTGFVAGSAGLGRP